jgi:hypothetical protein
LNITAAVKLLVKRYEEELGFTAAEINDGLCFNFADDLKVLVPEGVVEDYFDSEGDWSHAYFCFEGRYYDSEAPEGVEDFMQLPCCKRCSTST